MAGSRITCYLDGQELLQAEDEALAEPGMIGLWTKADAVTSFDDLIAKARTLYRCRNRDSRVWQSALVMPGIISANRFTPLVAWPSPFVGTR